jgi:hypothetical protein
MACASEGIVIQAQRTKRDASVSPLTVDKQLQAARNIATSSQHECHHLSFSIERPPASRTRAHIRARTHTSRLRKLLDAKIQRSLSSASFFVYLRCKQVGLSLHAGRLRYTRDSAQLPIEGVLWLVLATGTQVCRNLPLPGYS